ncbi:MAG: hypothetical protein LBG98_02900, partial [Puniceicoccales bacterium]|nr:hypothetical protein [Puniceicoccales bacterium]
MEIISTQGDGLCPLSSSRPVIIAIGVFDGVHLGHQRVILHTIECARSIGGIAAVYTFSPHPTSIVGTAKALIFPLEIKYKRIAALG